MLHEAGARMARAAPRLLCALVSLSLALLAYCALTALLRRHCLSLLTDTPPSDSPRTPSSPPVNAPEAVPREGGFPWTPPPDALARVPPQFRHGVSREEARVFSDLLSTLAALARRHSVPMFINYGTLLGSFRHHDIIPWDDDADVAMPYAQREVVWSLLRVLGGGYSVNKTADTQYRLAAPGSRLHRPAAWPWRWPYVDIDLYFENATHLWMLNSGSVYAYELRDVFPLHERPLGDVYLPAPRDPLRCITRTYPDYDACPSGMSHRLGVERPVRTLPCAALSGAYPFVHRSLAWDGVVWETLVLGNRSLYASATQELAYTAAVSPFTLKSPSGL